MNCGQVWDDAKRVCVIALFTRFGGLAFLEALEVAR